MWAVVVGCTLLAQADAPSVAVMRLEGKGIAQETADLLTENLVTELRDSRAFGRVVGAHEIETALGLEAQRQKLDCTTQGCMAEIAGALAVTYVLAGTAGRIGSSYLLNARLVNARTGIAASSVSLRPVGTTDDVLLDSVRPAIAKLLVDAGLARAQPPPETPPPESPGKKARSPRRGVMLVDEVSSVPARSWKGVPFRVERAAKLHVDVTVASGNDVDVYVVDQGEWTAIRAGRRFSHLPGFAAMRTRSATRSGWIREGSYFVAIHDGTLGLLSSSSTEVRVRASLGRAVDAGGAAP